MWKKTLLILLQVFWVISSYGGELLTDNQKKTSFLRALNESIVQVQQTKAQYQVQVTEAENFYNSIRTAQQNLRLKVNQPDFPPDGNRQTVTLLRQMVCRPDMALPMGIKQFGYAKGWDDYLGWAKGVKERLENDPVANAYLWYGRYDFYSGIELYQRLNDTLFNRRAAFITEVCGFIEQEFFTKLDALADKLDEFNQTRHQIVQRAREIMQITDEDQRNTAAAQLKEEADHIKQQAVQTKAAMDRIAGTLQSALQQRAIEMRRETEQLLEKVSALKIPERGRILDTTPSRIKFQNRRAFGVTFRGKGLPTGLAAADFHFPAGLDYIAHQGNSKRLYLRIQKSDLLTEGRHAIMIAGEPVYFTFENSEETDTAVSQPLVSNRPNLPTGTGQVPEGGRGTFLTPEALMDHPQDRRGYWRDVSRQNPSAAPYHFDQVKKQSRDWFILKGGNREPDIFEGLTPHQRLDVDQLGQKGIVGQFDRVQEDCYSGLRATREVPKPDGTEVCPHDRWWEPSTLCFDQNNLDAKEETDGRKHDEATCETTDTPTKIEGEYKRFVGLSFKPIAPGKYIHTVAVTAPASFQISVALEWDYSAIQPSQLALYIRSINGNQLLKQEMNAPVKSDGYVFTVNSPGRFSFEMNVFDTAGRVIHRDVAAAYLDH